MTVAAPGLYTGRVMHARVAPVRHRFTYHVFSLLLDLDSLAETARATRLFSYNRVNLLSFFDRDHGPRDGSPLRPWAERLLAGAGIDASGPMRLLSFPRLWGYTFNPIAIYYAHDRDGRLSGLLYQVHNTFGQSHAYAARVEADGSGRVTPHVAPKNMYVSPLIGPDATYSFRLTAPADRFSFSIAESGPEGPILAATHCGRRHALTDASILRAVALHPLMTAKVMVAIHWEALRLWLKGVRYVPEPQHPPGPVTIARAKAVLESAIDAAA